jgi:hypothetical protein
MLAQLEPFMEHCFACEDVKVLTRSLQLAGTFHASNREVAELAFKRVQGIYPCIVKNVLSLKLGLESDTPKETEAKIILLE